MENISLINNIIDKNKDEMINTLCNLVKIDSKASQPQKDKPFGKGVSDAFLYMLEKAEEDGFVIANIDNYGGHIELSTQNHKSEKTMGILCHLDVVPEGNDWDYNPFGAEIVDDKIYGRGTEDDKGPTIAAYYAMKAIKEAKTPIKNNVRLILGLDEETGWKGMDYYLAKVEQPDFGFTPDGDFPVINGEKGILIFELAQKFTKGIPDKIELRSIKGGNAPNMVADFARAVVFSKDKEVYERIKHDIAEYREKTGYKVKCKGVGKSFEIVAEGISSHGARPEKGLNSISIIMEILGKIEFNSEDVNDFIEFYNKYIGFEYTGESLGINLHDDISGDTRVNVGTIELDKEAVRLAVNVRFPISYIDEDVYEKLNKIVTGYNIGIVKTKYQKSIYMDENSELVMKLMNAYQEITKDYDSKPLIIGGGTYARAMENFVAFGGKFPNEEERAHQKNECISIESLINSCKIYAKAIYDLCCE